MNALPFLVYLIQLQNAGGLEHSDDTARLSVEIARRAGMDKRMIEIIEFGARVHDIGKIGIPPSIVGKVGKYTFEEMRAMKRHPEIGAEMLGKLLNIGNGVIPDGVIEIVLQHHENYDGTGYPKGIRGEEIHPGARILRVADSFHAMTTSYRVWRPILTPSAALSIMMDYKNHYDPEYLKILYEVNNHG